MSLALVRLLSKSAGNSGRVIRYQGSLVLTELVPVS